MPSDLHDVISLIATDLAKVTITDPQVRSNLALLLNSLRAARAGTATPPTRDYAALLERALVPLQTTSMANIAMRLRRVYLSLPWGYHYAPRSVSEDLGERIGFAELVGPDGPLRTPSGRVGFTLMAEQTRYPMHAHPAVELYWVMSGTARWQTPSSDRTVPPGQFVLHQSNEAHAMVTLDEPLLALWGWSGDTDTPAAYT